MKKQFTQFIAITLSLIVVLTSMPVMHVKAEETTGAKTDDTVSEPSVP